MLKKFQIAKKIQSMKIKPKSNQKSHPNSTLHANMERNLNLLKKLLGHSSDLRYREFQVYEHPSISILVCYVDGLVNEDFINMHLIKPLMSAPFYSNYQPTEDFYSIVKKRVLSTSSLKESNCMADVVEGLLTGETAIFINGSNSAVLIGTQGFEARNVDEPETESSVRGSREGFNEVLKVNTSLIRRKIHNPNLVFEDMKIGKQTKTKVRIGYIKGIVDSKIVDEVRNRLNRIDTDVILESGYIEQYIEDHPYSIFPTIANSEKPDKIAAKMLEGRVAIFCDGTPFVLTVPHLFIEALQVGEDYYSRPYLSSLMRLFRVLALLLTIGTPSVFVAIATFHHEMVPALLLTTMAAAEEKVPFPVFIEAMLMIIVFELLKEAGVRMPRPVGSAISIVGALVIGEAAVQAGLVSAPMVIVVALTAITGFIVTALNDAVVLSRFFLLFLAASFGFYGILMGTLVLLGHMCSLRSFGSPYLAPVAPILINGWKDALVRLPLWSQITRPQAVTWKKSKRENGLQNKPHQP